MSSLCSLNYRLTNASSKGANNTSKGVGDSSDCISYSGRDKLDARRDATFLLADRHDEGWFLDRVQVVCVFRNDRRCWPMI